MGEATVLVSPEPRNHTTMSKRSKRYQSAKKKLTTATAYPLAEALAALREDPTKFDATVELHIRLGIDVTKSDQNLRGSVQLPHGTGNTKTVIAFVNADKEAEAKEAGADIIGTPEVIAEIKKTGKINFDVAVATPDMMRQIGQIARILGQQGVMPNPKTETVGPDAGKMVKAIKDGKINFKNDDTGNLHLSVGKLSFTDEKLTENIKAAITAINKAKPSTSKGQLVKSSVLSSSMGPGIPVTLE